MMSLVSRPPDLRARSASKSGRALSIPPSHQQFPLFDSLRALAALAILVVHVAIFSGAATESLHGKLLVHLDIGVPFFFLLSAFLLYRPFVVARVQGAERTGFFEYAKRRFLRIAPAYWAALTIAAIVPGVGGAFTGNWWVYYGLLQNLPIYTNEGVCAVDAYRCGIPVAWSLAVEVAFYAVLPLFVLLMAWIGQRRSHARWLSTELWAVLVLSLVSVMIMSLRPYTDLWPWLFFSPLGRGYWFGTGLALAALSVWVQTREAEPRFVDQIRRRSGLLLALAAALYVFSSLVFDALLAAPVGNRSDFVAQYVAVGVIVVLVTLPAIFGLDGGGLPRRALAHPVLAWLGLVSYGIFLWQFPVLLVLLDVGILNVWPPFNFPILLIATFTGTVACAAVSYYGLERPLARRMRRDPPRPERAPGPDGLARPTNA